MRRRARTTRDPGDDPDVNGRPDSGIPPRAALLAAPVTRETPLVSVIAQCYNHERFLDACLTSIHRQTLQDFELIVVDDCSTDRSAERIAAWIQAHRPTARFLHLRTNRGVSASLNAAIAEARGTYVTRLATDDVWEPTFLDAVVRRFESLPAAYGAVYSDAWCIDEQGRRLETPFIEAHRPGLIPPEGDILNELATANFIPAAAIVIKREVLRAVGVFDEALAYEDWDMWLRIAARFLIGYVPDRLAHYRIVDGSLARTLFAPDRAPSPDVRLTHWRMAQKLMGIGRLQAPVREYWRGRMIEDAKSLYRLGDARAWRVLMESARLTRDYRVGVWALAAGLGLPAAAIERLLGRVRRRTPQ